MLTPCPACNRFVREDACPFCGADVVHPRLVRRTIGHGTRAMIAFGTAAATTISLPLAACSDDNTSAPNFSEAGAYGGFFVDAADAHGDVSWTGSGAYGADAGGPYGVDAGHDANADEGGDTDADTSSDSGDAGDQ